VKAATNPIVKPFEFIVAHLNHNDVVVFGRIGDELKLDAVALRNGVSPAFAFASFIN
jgi:hypothetical protein